MDKPCGRPGEDPETVVQGPSKRRRQAKVKMDPREPSKRQRKVKRFDDESTEQSKRQRRTKREKPQNAPRRQGRAKISNRVEAENLETERAVSTITLPMEAQAPEDHGENFDFVFEEQDVLEMLGRAEDIPKAPAPEDPGENFDFVFEEQDILNILAQAPADPGENFDFVFEEQDVLDMLGRAEDIPKALAPEDAGENFDFVFEEQDVLEILGRAEDIPEYMGGGYDFMGGVEMAEIMQLHEPFELEGDQDTLEVNGNGDDELQQLGVAENDPLMILGDDEVPGVIEEMEVEVSPDILPDERARNDAEAERGRMEMILGIPAGEPGQQEVMNGNARLRHVCHFCPRRFAQAAQLARHATTHNKDPNRPQYVCPHCDAPFRLPMSVNYHIRKDHPGLPKYQY